MIVTIKANITNSGGSSAPPWKEYREKAEDYSNEYLQEVEFRISHGAADVDDFNLVDEINRRNTGSGSNSRLSRLSSLITWKAFESGKLQEHYDKHVVAQGEFGPITQAQYLKLAKEFAAELGEHIQEQVVGDYLIKYDKKTGRIFIGYPGTRQIRSFYIDDKRSNDPFGDAVKTAEEKMDKKNRKK